MVIFPKRAFDHGRKIGSFLSSRFDKKGQELLDGGGQVRALIQDRFGRAFGPGCGSRGGRLGN